MDSGYIERIELAISESRQQVVTIERLREETRNETRPLVIQENQAKLGRLIREHEEYDEMTRNAYFRYYRSLNDFITKLSLKGRSLTDSQRNMLTKAGEYMRRLLELKTENSDIIYDDGTRSHTRGIESSSSTKTKIEDFMKHFDELTSQINRVKASLVLDNAFPLDLNDTIRELDSEVESLSNEADEIIREIDEFRNAYGSADFSMSPKEIKVKLKDIKDRIKNLKISQIDRYNAKVDAVNKRIVKLKAMGGLDADTLSMISGLEELKRCDKQVKTWKQTNYLKDIDYDKLLSILKQIDDIEKKLGRVSETNINLEDDINYIEQEIEKAKELSEDELKDRIIAMADFINQFRVKLEDNKDKLSEEEYNSYLDRISDAEANLAELNNKLAKDDSIYKVLMADLNKIDDDLTQNENLMDALIGKVTLDGLKVFQDNLDKITTNLDKIQEDIEEAHNSGKIDNVQYDNLIDKVIELEEKLSKDYEKLKDPKAVKDVDIFAFLNGEIDGIEKAINELETQVDALEKPIKDNETRAKIEAISNQLEKYKDEDPEKYEAAKKRLEELKQRLENIKTKYRSKCPLQVKAKKSAKDFYKKHKKLTLWAAGLAAVALVHATIGPIIIPAIMHGNIMIMNKIPGLRRILYSINSILGKAIHAKIVPFGNGFNWQLANGSYIDPACASISLLKGIAISGIGSALLASPLVIAVKHLVNKMKQADLKEKLKEEKEKIKDKTKAVTSKVKGEVDEKKEERKREKEELKRIKELLKEYKESGLSFEEFCASKGLSEEDAVLLSKEEKKRGGRR